MTRARATWVAVVVALAACSSGGGSGGGGGAGGSVALEAVRNVVTLRGGTVAELSSRRGTGPFREYDVAPARMVALVEDAVRMRTNAVFADVEQGEVVGKERSGAEAREDAYAPEWRSAVLVFVHRVPGAPSRSRVEVHATHRGAFLRGRIDWERDLPPLIDAAAAGRLARRIRPL